MGKKNLMAPTKVRHGAIRKEKAIRDITIRKAIDFSTSI